MSQDLQIAKAASLIAAADGLLITAGAGMGVDSGLPDFRGTAGFWQAYPVLGRAKIRFEEIASPAAFEQNPRLAWGFYGHRLQLYRDTMPHAGFGILGRWAAAKPNRCFVFTSNVDGQFQKAGFDPQRVLECHGSIHHLQCLDRCSEEIWPADTFHPLVDMESGLLLDEMPRCSQCGALARPNVLMFGDWEWINTRARIQGMAFTSWLKACRQPVVIEIGAGQDIPTVRRFGEQWGWPLIRINPRDCRVSRETDVALALPALQALLALDARLHMSWS